MTGAPTPRPAHPALGVAMVIVASVLFAVNGTVSKLILEAGVDAQRLTMLRAIGAWLGLLLILTVLPGGLRRLRTTRRELPLLVVYGLAGYFLVPMLYFVTIRRLPVGIGLLFEYTAPLLVALWARFAQRRSVRRRLWYGLAVSLVGLAGVAEVGQSSLRLDPVGVAAGFAAAVLLCCYYLLGARTVAQRDATSLTWFAFGVSAIAGLLTAAVRGATGGGALFPAHILGHTSHGAPVWALTIYLVVGGTLVPYLLTVGALRHLPPTSVGIIAMLEPVTAAAVAWVVLDERLTVTQLLGGALVLVGVGIAETARTAGPGGPPEVPPA